MSKDARVTAIASVIDLHRIFMMPVNQGAGIRCECNGCGFAGKEFPIPKTPGYEDPDRANAWREGFKHMAEMIVEESGLEIET